MTSSPFAAPLPSAPAVLQRALLSGWEGWRAALDGTADYWGGAVRRGATPLDVAALRGHWPAILAGVYERSRLG